jgi:hypothetical protein
MIRHSVDIWVDVKLLVKYMHILFGKEWISKSDQRYVLVTRVRSKPAQNTRLGLLSSDVAQRPRQKLFIEYVDKFPRSKTGNTVILVCVDAFSKFVWLLPVREATTKATVKALKERIFSSFSVPQGSCP